MVLLVMWAVRTPSEMLPYCLAFRVSSFRSHLTVPVFALSPSLKSAEILTLI